MDRAVAWSLVAILALVLVWGYIHRPEVPEVDPGAIQRVDSLALRNAALESEIIRMAHEYADSLSAWEERRDELQARARQAASDGARIADQLRAALDTAGVRMLDELQAAHRVEVAAERERAETFEAQVVALEERVSLDAMAILGLRAEIEARAALDAERVRVNDALRSALNRANRDKRLLAVAGVGLALVALR